MSVRNSIFILLMSFLIFGCATDNKPKGKTAAEILFKEAKALQTKGRYILASERLNQLRSQYPYSFYATHAELLQADIYFSQENYTEAAAAYQLFRDFHPKFKNMVYVIFRIAESYFKGLPPTFDRDLSSAYLAAQHYNELVQKYSKSNFTKSAARQLEIVEKMLMDKEQYIADFYFKTEVYDSARFRYLTIIDSKTNKDLRDHSMIRIVKSSYLLKEFKDCLKYSKLYRERVSKESTSEIDELAADCSNP